MRKILVMAFAVMMLVWTAGSAQATFWVPDDGNANYPNYTVLSFDMNTIGGSEILGMFDDSVTVANGTFTSGQYLSLLPSSSTSVTVAFTYTGSAWTATSGGDSISLGGSNVFQLGFFDGSDWMTDISYVGGNSVYTISFDYDDYATQADANPVPIPPSAIMLFSGILGLFGVRRMRRDS